MFISLFVTKVVATYGCVANHPANPNSWSSKSHGCAVVPIKIIYSLMKSHEITMFHGQTTMVLWFSYGFSWFSSPRTTASAASQQPHRASDAPWLSVSSRRRDAPAVRALPGRWNTEICLPGRWLDEQMMVGISPHFLGENHVICIYICTVYIIIYMCCICVCVHI